MNIPYIRRKNQTNDPKVELKKTQLGLQARW